MNCGRERKLAQNFEAANSAMGLDPFELDQRMDNQSFLQKELQPPPTRTMEFLSETIWDVVIDGTGLQRSLLAL